MEMSSPQFNPERDAILDKIKSGKIKPHSKWYFVLKACGIAVGMFLMIGLVLYLTSFIVFALRGNGVMLFTDLGPRGFMRMLFALPWLLILLTVVLIGIVELQMRYFQAVYRRPFIYSLAAILLVVISVGSLIGASEFHRNLMQISEQGKFPVLPGFYEQFGDLQPRDVHFGVVMQAAPVGFILQTPDEQNFHVIITSQTELPRRVEIIDGDRVIVLGTREDDTIEALTIRKIMKERMPFFRKLVRDVHLKPFPPVK